MTIPRSSPHRRTLFADLIDYAGVFPPAALELGEALSRYARASRGEGRWIVGPCLVRASQLSRIPSHQAPPRLGVVLDLPLSEMPVHPVVQLEVVVSSGSVEEVMEAAARLSPVIYAESRSPADFAYLEEIASLRKKGIDGRAKIRTGGLTPAAVPSTERLARFIESAIGLRVPFKATAGLHRPIRHPHGAEHGFVNVLAAVRAALGGEVTAVRHALRETDPVRLNPRSARWCETGSGVSCESVRSAFRSFGSCSLTEPLEHLRQLGVPASGIER